MTDIFSEFVYICAFLGIPFHWVFGAAFLASFFCVIRGIHDGKGILNKPAAICIVSFNILLSTLIYMNMS